MKTSTLLLILFAGLAVIGLIWLAGIYSVLTEDLETMMDAAFMVPGYRIPSDTLREWLKSPDPEVVIGGLYFLQDRKDPSGLDLALPLLEHEDDYVWFNAAGYPPR